MFWKKNKNEHTIHVMTLGLDSAAAAKGAAMGAGQIGGSLLGSSGVHEMIENQVKKRLANAKFAEEFAAAPLYKITESYDVKTHKDTYFLTRKEQQYQGGWNVGGTESDYRIVYVQIFSSEKKADVVARFNRVMPKKVARKKAA